MSKTIAGKGFKLDWFEQEITLVIDKAENSVIRSAAFRILMWAKLKIQENGQIDTGFMWNSGYVIAHNTNQYASAAASSTAANPNALLAPMVTLPKNAGALVAFGANYALWQEIKNSFLRWAFEQTTKEFPSIVQISKRTASL